MRNRLILLFLICLSTSFAQAQVDTCPAEVETALNVVADGCSVLGRNQVCYGHRLMDVELRSGEASLSEVGDIADVSDLLLLRTAPLSLETGEWGVAVFRVQANLPDTLPGQNVTLLVFGDAEVQPQPEAPQEFSGPMQAFQLLTGVGDTACRDVPVGGVLVQSPHDQPVNLLVNGFELRLGSTALLAAARQDELTITTLEGNIQVTADGVTQDVPAGFTLTVTQDTPPEQAEHAPEVPVLPVELLPEPVPDFTPRTVSLPGNLPDDAWMDSGITLVTGQHFSLAASGNVDIYPDCESTNTTEYSCNVMRFGPEGSAGIGPGGGDYPLPGTLIGALIARIGGDGSPFLVGPGGGFTAGADGVLQFRMNDFYLDDNTGEFTITFQLSPD